MKKRSKKPCSKDAISYQSFELHHTINGRKISTDLTAEQLALQAGVNIKTAKRWIAGTQNPHPDTLELLKIKTFGLLPDPEFADYYVQNGRMRNRSGDLLTPNDLDLCIWLRRAYNDGRDANERLKAELDAILELIPTADIIRRKARARADTQIKAKMTTKLKALKNN